MQKIHWDDYRVAYQVAESGSLNKAAVVLGCNHATVLRHVNRLEKALDIKLFIRHQRGYQLTDAGQLLVAEMPTINNSLNHLEEQLHNLQQELSGHLRITSLTEFSPVLNPALYRFRQAYPKVRIQLISTDELVPPASGIAHVALRAGPQPQDPDLLAFKLMDISSQYYAADSYIQQRGLPASPQEYQQHDWVMPSHNKHHIPYVQQVLKHIEMEQVVYQSNQFLDIESAVSCGLGIGLVSSMHIQQQPHLRLANIPITQKTMGSMWFVYHRDLKDNAKIKQLYQYLLLATNDQTNGGNV